MKHKLFVPSFKNLSIKTFEKRGNMSGYEVYEPNHHDYIEVVNIGEDKSDSEVTIFFRPNKSFQLVQYRISPRDNSFQYATLYCVLLVAPLGFKIVNAYLVSEKQRTTHGRDYTMLNIVSSKENRFVDRRYKNGGAWLIPLLTLPFCFERNFENDLVIFLILLFRVPFREPRRILAEKGPS